MGESLYSIKINRLGGDPLDWESFKHKKILIVNVASECGYTGQYSQLEELFRSNQDRLNILGCPCNDFGGQEPGEAKDIEQFCKLNYGVTFPLTEKLKIKKDPHALYQWMTTRIKNGKGDFEVMWNFHKFLVNEDGQMYSSISSGADPFCEDILNWLN